MYVTKKNMATAVSNMTQHLGQLSDALAVSSMIRILLAVSSVVASLK